MNTQPVPRLKGHSLPDLVLAYEEGRTLREIASEVGVSHVHLARLLKAQGAVMRSRASNTAKTNAAKADLAQIHSAHAVVLYSYGVPLDEIARSLRRPIEWIADQVRDAGLAAGGIPR